MRHVLIVDDNRAMAENLAEILRDAGTEVTVASSGVQALEQVKHQRFDALITDMKMPVMGGAQLVHEIRRLDPGLPAIIVTAYTREDDLAGAQHEGILAVLPKPVPISQLLQLVAAARRDGLVALVEDDPGLSENLVEALRDRGFTAIAARSSLETERLGGVRPFAALVDLHLPGSPRGEVLALLAKAFAGLPLIVTTGFPDLKPQTDSYAVLLKPVDTARMLGMLEDLYQRRVTP